MAGLLFHAPSGEVALVATVAKTVITLTAGSNDRLKLLGIEVFFKGTVTTDTPVKIEISRITTDGGTATTITPAPNDNNASETIQATVKANYTVEPTTYGANLKTWEVHPQTGLVVYFPLGQELQLKGGTEIGIRLTASQVETVSINLVVDE